MLAVPSCPCPSSPDDRNGDPKPLSPWRPIRKAHCPCTAVRGRRLGAGRLARPRRGKRADPGVSQAPGARPLASRLRPEANACKGLGPLNVADSLRAVLGRLSKGIWRCRAGKAGLSGRWRRPAKRGQQTEALPDHSGVRHSQENRDNCLISCESGANVSNFNGLPFLHVVPPQAKIRGNRHFVPAPRGLSPGKMSQIVCQLRPAR